MPSFTIAKRRSSRTPSQWPDRADGRALPDRGRLLSCRAASTTAGREKPSWTRAASCADGTGVGNSISALPIGCAAGREA